MTDAALVIEPGSISTTGTCECCGRVSRSLTGVVSEGERTLAAYLFHWTVGHFPDLPANIDLILGKWGDESVSSDRVAVSLELVVRDEQPDVKVIDAGTRPIAKSELVGTALGRSSVIGTPRAGQVFSVIDAIFEQDARLPVMFEQS